MGAKLLSFCQILTACYWILDYMPSVSFFVDANECAEGLSNCNGNTVCLNTLGTYRCKCKEGYFQIGRTCFSMCHLGFDI